MVRLTLCPLDPEQRRGHPLRLRRLLPVLVGVLALAVASTACADQPTPAADGAAETVGLQVFAAASLTAAFQEIGDTFAVDHPEADLAFNFAGSQQLASQIKEGAQADVFASANQRQMDGVVAAGDVISGTQRAFARNRLVVVIPPDNPAELRGLADLGRPDLKMVLAAKAVPAGSYALAFLGKASAHPDFTPAYSATVMANVVSFEDDIVGVLGKVAQGEADAGIVYLSDVSGPAAPKVGRIDIPEALNVIATYPIAPLADALIMVVREGISNPREITESVKRLTHVGVRPAGVVLNGMQMRRHRYGYCYAYEYGYGQDTGTGRLATWRTRARRFFKS